MSRPFSPACVSAVLIFVLVNSATCAEDIRIVLPETVGMSSAKLAQIDTVMEQLVSEQKLPGAVVLVSRKGQIVYLKSFGKKDLADGKPMTSDTIFRIFSMTKAITSAAALMLVEDGKLQLDAPVAKYIEDFANVQVSDPNGNRKPARPPTVRDLMRHTAGLTYGIFGDSEVDRMYKAANVLQPTDDNKTLAAKVGRLPLEYDPGTAWKYSVSTDVLGRVVEVASGMSFGDLLQKRLFGPLNMVDTGFHVPAAKLDRLATNYNSNGTGTLTPIDVPATSPLREPRPLQSGGGGLVSTIRDYHQFLQMISQGGTLGPQRLLTAESVKFMTTNQLPKEVSWIQFGGLERKGVGFGLGFSVREEMSLWDVGGRVGEYGWGGAASTHYWVSPKDELVVITMEQVMPYSFLTEFAVKGLIYNAIEN